MSNRIKYIQLAPGEARFQALDGQIMLIVKNYTKLFNTSEQSSDGATHTYRVSVPEELYYEVNGEGMINVGPKGAWGHRHELATVLVESLKQLDPPAHFSGTVIGRSSATT
jgi:arginine decarboxylase-like protein